MNVVSQIILSGGSRIEVRKAKTWREAPKSKLAKLNVKFNCTWENVCILFKCWLPQSRSRVYDKVSPEHSPQ